MRFKKLLCLLLFISFGNLYAQKPAFHIVPLGVFGGIDEGNLSAYMVAPYGSNNYVCLDAGTLHRGIQQAINHHVFHISGDSVLKQYIKAYLLSHPHLDHVAGLVINSPDDAPKNIYALGNCIDVLKTHYFTWQSWANFADSGEQPQLGKYHYNVLMPDVLASIPNTEMQVKAFPLSHSNLTSTAFLLQNGANYLLYLGDTGADKIEKNHNLDKLWQHIAPLVKNHQLKAIMIEVSFPNEQPSKSLFGHLTPELLMAELTNLSHYSGPDTLKGFSVIITHLKPPLQSIQKIKAQLKSRNNLGLNLIFPEQGSAIDL